MASGYEKISLVKSKLRSPMTVTMLAESLDCSERTVFRYLDVIDAENCGLRKYKDSSAGETFYVIQPDEKVNFNQNIVKQLEKIKKNLATNSAPELKTIKVLDKVMGLLQTTDPNEFKPEAISTDPDYVLDYGPFCDDKLQDALVNRVLKAIHSGSTIRMHYRHSTDHSAVSEETKEVNPVKVIMRMDSLYLIAGEIDEKGNQVFKNYLFENIDNVTETNHSAPRFVFDAKTHYKYAFGKFTGNGKVEDISLEIRTKWLQTQFERSHFNPPVAKRFDKNKNMIVDMKLRITPDFKTWLMGVAPDIRILKPASLRDEIKQMMKTALAEMDA